MALYSLRLRRTLTLTSSLIKHQRGRALSTIPAISDSPPSSILHNLNSQPTHDCPFQSRSFRSSSFSLSSSRSYNNNNDDDKISPDTILFEGCDYNHWLITMDFPKDPKPTAEEMVETYVQTLAKVVGSVEEAKKKMYACSTTTYTGFQAVMTEEMSEKFRGLPGVVFILPDSYIDPVNKEYGGDKYINGTIIPRPPPVQYGRSGGRYGDRNRNYDRRDSPRGPMPNQQGNPAYNRQGSMQGDGRNYGPPQNFPPQQNYGPPQNLPPQQNYGPTGQGERRDPMPVNNRDYAPGGRDTYQGDRRDPMPSYQGSYNQGERGNYHPQEQRNFLQGDQRDYAPAERRDYAPPEQRDFRGDNRNYAPPQGAGGTYGQGAGGTYGQGMGSGYGQSYPGHGEAQRFSQVEQRNDMQGEKRNYPPMGHTGTDQGKF